MKTNKEPRIEIYCILHDNKLMSYMERHNISSLNQLLKN